MIRTTEEFRKALRDARRASTPLIAIRTADPASAFAHFVVALNGKANETPILWYDFMTALTGKNEVGQFEADQMNGSDLANPADMLSTIRNKVCEFSLIFFANPQRVWEQPDILQGIWNLRDTFKQAGATLVLLTTPGATLPPEITNDVMVYDEPLPAATDLQDMILSTFQQADLPTPSQEVQARSVDALIGLPAFPAEQVLAMSISKKGVDVEQLWERKIQTIMQTPGLTVWRGGQRFDSIGGCHGVKQYLRDSFNGKDPARVICFIDEIN